MKKVKRWFSERAEECKFAAAGIVLATKTKRFWIVFFTTFIIFGTLLNLLSAGFASFNLMSSVGFGGSIKIIWDAFLQIFGFNREFLDWLSIFFLTILQSLIIALLTVVWKTNKKAKDSSDQSKKSGQKIKHNKIKSRKSSNSENLQNSGIVAGLLLLCGGCPTCGTALLTPILGAIFSTGGVAIAAKISGILTAVAVLLALWTLKKVGYDAYVALVVSKMNK